jgi:hypothetical protein
VSAFLTAIGGKLADRWLSLLLLPGLLWVGTLVTAVRLGQTAPFNATALRESIDRQASSPAAHTAGTVLLAATAILLASAAAGLAASALGNLAQQLWTRPGRRRPLAWIIQFRQHRWDQATTTLKTAIAWAANPEACSADRSRAEDQARAAAARRDRLGLIRPERPTWIADRFRSTAARSATAYGLDLEPAWPRLWTVLPDTLRTNITTAQDMYAASARLAGWAVLYLILAAIWWPAAVLGLAVFATAILRARSSVHVLADLIDTAIDLHTADLATKLGVTAEMPLTARTGQAITRILSEPALSRPPTGSSSPQPIPEGVPGEHPPSCG